MRALGVLPAPSSGQLGSACQIAWTLLAPVPRPGPPGHLLTKTAAVPKCAVDRLDVVEIAKKDVGPDDVFTEDANAWVGVSAFIETARGSVMRAVLCIALGWARRWCCTPTCRSWGHRAQADDRSSWYLSSTQAEIPAQASDVSARASIFQAYCIVSRTTYYRHSRGCHPERERIDNC